MTSANPSDHSTARLPHLALTRYLPEDLVMTAAREAGWCGRRRVLDPWLCLWGLIAQALWGNASQCLVTTLLAAASGRSLSAGSGAYCRGRRRLRVAMLVRLAAHLAGTARGLAQPGEGRRLVLDGGCVALSDSRANQARFPQSKCQKPGCGYPVLRLSVLMDGRTGAVWAWSVGAGETSELALAQPLLAHLQPGDVLVADRGGYGTYGFLGQLRGRGVDVIARQHGSRHNQRPGRSRDWVETWTCPPNLHQVHQDIGLPSTQQVRCVWFARPDRSLMKLVTTLPREAVGARTIRRCYRERWRIETQFNQLKTGQGADFLPARSPGMVRRAVGAQMLALNLLGAWRCEVAREQRTSPWRVSLAGLREALLATVGHRDPVVQQRRWLLRCAPAEVVPERPGRSEPRRVKRRPKPYTHLTQPRDELRAQLVGGR